MLPSIALCTYTHRLDGLVEQRCDVLLLIPVSRTEHHHSILRERTDRECDCVRQKRQTVRERERERHRQTDRQTDRQTLMLCYAMDETITQSISIAVRSGIEDAAVLLQYLY